MLTAMIEITFQTLGFVIGTLFFAVLLRIATKWVEKVDVPYWNAFATCLLFGIVDFLFDTTVRYAVARATHSILAVDCASLLLYPVGYLIASWFISLRLRIPFRRALLVVLVIAGIFVGVFAIVAIPIFLIMSFTQ